MTDKKSEVTDKKSEVTQTTRCGRVSKRNVKAPVLTSESDINLSLGENPERTYTVRLRIIYNGHKRA